MPKRIQRIVLLPPPSLNALYTPAIVDGHAAIFLTKVARDWKKGQTQMLQFLKPVPRPRQVKLEVLWLMTKEDKGDCDNRLKLLQDALEGHGYENDDQVAELHVYRVRDQKWSRMEIMIEDLTPRVRGDRGQPDKEVEP